MLVTQPSENNEWETQCDAETLIKAWEIAGDEKRVENVKAFFTKQSEAMKDLSGDDFYKKLIGLR